MSITPGFQLLLVGKLGAGDAISSEKLAAPPSAARDTDLAKSTITVARRPYPTIFTLRRRNDRARSERVIPQPKAVCERPMPKTERTRKHRPRRRRGRSRARRKLTTPRHTAESTADHPTHSGAGRAVRIQSDLSQPVFSSPHPALHPTLTLSRATLPSRRTNLSYIKQTDYPTDNLRPPTVSLGH